jgi:hypothetical protein
MGLSCFIEDSAFEGRKTKTLFIGGSALEVQIIVDNNIVKNVTLNFPASAPIVARHTKKASEILTRDLLLRPNQSPLTKYLDKFAANLEHLANLDKLSVMPGLDCHEALEGIFDSLEQVHKWDIKKLQDDPAMSAGRSEKFLETKALCTRNGRPVMHARDRVGLSLEYWKENRLIAPSTHDSEIYAEQFEEFWSILIGCAPLNREMYPIRISNNWISPSIEKGDPSPEELLANSSGGPILDWLEPPSTFLPATDDTKGTTIDIMGHDGTLTTQKLPEVMFTAKFEPAIIVPQSAWLQLYTITGVSPMFTYPLATFDSIYFPPPQGVSYDASEARTIECRRKLDVMAPDGAQEQFTARNRLLIYKPVYGHTVSELPFSHPRQLVQMLPILRQYALLSTLLEKSFADKGHEPEAASPNSKNLVIRKTTTVRDELEKFKANGNGDMAEDSFDMDVTLTVHPVPRLQVIFPYRSMTGNIVLEIRLNGVVHIVSQNIIPDEENGIEAPGKGKGKQKGRDILKQGLGSLLELVEDLNKWCYCIRTQIA